MCQPVQLCSLMFDGPCEMRMESVMQHCSCLDIAFALEDDLLIILTASPLLIRGLAVYSLLQGVGSLCAGVPRVFDRIHNGVISKIDEKGGMAAKLFHWGYRMKSKKLKRNVRCDQVLLHSHHARAELQ